MGLRERSGDREARQGEPQPAGVDEPGTLQHEARFQHRQKARVAAARQVDNISVYASLSVTKELGEQAPAEARFVHPFSVTE